MSRALAVRHGRFGRAALYSLDRDMATHAHREGHLLFRLDGPAAAMRVGETDLPLDERSGIAVCPWRPHSFAAGCARRAATFLILYIRPDWLGALRGPTRAGLRFGAPVIERTAEVDAGVDRLAALLAGGRGDPDAAILDLADACQRQSWRRGPAPDAVGPRDFRVRRSMRLIESLVGEGRSVALDRIARGAGLSRSHFFALFRDNLGMTPNLYLNMLRMETAIERLVTTPLAVTAIGIELGFASQASFTRFFAANAGVPPSDYRRMAGLAA